MFTRQFRIPSADEALPGRAEAMPVPERHFVLNTPLQGPFPGKRQIQFGMGCFWGAEKQFWSLPGVYTTAVGYSGGHTPNPTYREVCSGQTGHTEAVLVVYDPARISLDALFKVFWESHDPTQGMRQGNDAGTQYRSAVYAGDRRSLLLRGGVPPAVPREESRRLLWPGGNGCGVPDGGGRQSSPMSRMLSMSARPL
jgi:peptide-methionine (S)-S-oxide reductase